MPTINFDSVPSNIPYSEDRVQQLSDRAAETVKAFARKIEKLQATYHEARQKFAQESSELVRDTHPENRAAAKDFAKQQEAQRVRNMRHKLVENSENERTEMLRTLKAYADEAAAIQALCESPVMLLGRTALGDAKRTQYQMQLDGAGPKELEAAARQAIMGNDTVLAAAICTVIDRRPRDRRPFPAAEFAERIVGPVWQRVNTKLKGVQVAFQTAINANREFVRGRADPLSNLSNALARKAVAEAEEGIEEAAHQV